MRKTLALSFLASMIVLAGTTPWVSGAEQSESGRILLAQVPISPPSNTPGFELPSTNKNASPEKCDDGSTPAPKAHVNVPLRLASFAAGAVAGTPIAVVRKCKEEMINATVISAEDSKNPLRLTLAGIMGVPFGLWSGIFDGAYSGLKTSLIYSGEKPFSKDTFSLGELK